MQHLPWKRKGC